MNLRDILYFDFDKAASLVSQLEGGLAKQRAETSEETQDERNIRKYELLKVFKSEFGGIQTDKKTVLETKVLHHDLLVRLEETLIELGFATNINGTVSISDNSSLEIMHSEISKSPYVKVEGWCAFEDFEKLYESTKNFNDLLGFIKRCELNSVLNIDQLKLQLKSIEEESGKNSKRYKDATAEFKKYDKLITENIDKAKLPEWLFEGVREWIDTYIDGRLNLRVCPFEEFPEIEIIANLKRTCFIDDDLKHLMYGYGSEPNRKLCVLGLVTSVPPRDETTLFDMYEPYVKKKDIEGETEVEAIERAFRAIFPALRNMEKFTSFHSYPRIVVHPIAVYRNIQPVSNNMNKSDS
ncbi:hypothetical protein [Neptuniibacter sp. CAU 1671]|uniref:DUF6414 family protein n=1 Tax=Neptuniibacter sp. CAU 1671 TaxID=3032593 RepID=UPI0023DBD48A|nr:hypothetical protein [Neptuniibacter sp. CAU 1671]MDF2181153.1 hypothetical protein [Neptuniibacter sp. CAU 1671]